MTARFTQPSTILGNNLLPTCRDSNRLPVMTRADGGCYVLTVAKHNKRELKISAYHD